MHLLQIDHVIHNVEPDPHVTFEGWFVLPSLMGGALPGHNTQIPGLAIVIGCCGPRRSGQEVPRINQGIPVNGIQIDTQPRFA